MDVEESISIGLKLGAQIVKGLWVLIVTVFGLGVGGAVYVTKLDYQITHALTVQRDLLIKIQKISEDFVPGSYLRSWRESLQLEDRRQQVQIDRLESAKAGVPYNGRGYDGVK
jgi:hypothetical protein